MAENKYDLVMFADEIESHRAWLRGFEAVRKKRWEGMLSREPEAAIVEALVRKLLAARVERVLPAEDSAKGGPDFLCFQKNRRFYVEATCLLRETVTRETSLPSHPVMSPRSQHYRPLTEASFAKCVKKAPQCADLNASCLLFIGTLHRSAGMLCFGKTHLEEVLTGEVKLAGRLNMKTGQPIGKPYQMTQLEKAAFLKPGESGGFLYAFARKSIAGIVFCAFGSAKPNVIGILNPGAARPFDIGLLPGICFGRILLEDTGLRVVWH